MGLKSVIARSTLETEFIALDIACSVAEWLKSWISDLFLVYKLVPAISVHRDSRAVIKLLKQKTTNSKLNRHLQIRYKSIKRLLDRFVTLEFVMSLHYLPFTKGLARNVIPVFVKRGGVKPYIRSSTVGIVLAYE